MGVGVCVKVCVLGQPYVAALCLKFQNANPRIYPWEATYSTNPRIYSWESLWEASDRIAKLKLSS
jgi:hypothetical protein